LLANAGCTKHIFGVGQVAVAGNSTATGLIRVSVWVPRRAPEIQPFRGIGQCMDSKLRAHPAAADGLRRVGDAAAGVL